MKKAAILALAATPSVALAYLLLLAYILRRVKPLPITFLPHSGGRDVAPPQAQPRSHAGPVAEAGGESAGRRVNVM